jgi:septum formation protein
MQQKLILASQSPRRKQLLEWAEMSFEVVVKNTDETFPDGLAVEEIPVYIARQKAEAVKQMLIAESKLPVTSIVILAADTVVVLDNQIIGKPANREDAIKILTSLSGQPHKVITGVVIQVDEREIAFSEITSVVFHPLSPSQIAFYVDKYQPYDKAGAYAIQEWIGVVGIKSIDGDFYNVMGLPVSRVVQELSALGFAGVQA